MSKFYMIFCQKNIFPKFWWQLPPPSLVSYAFETKLPVVCSCKIAIFYFRVPVSRWCMLVW